MTPWTVTAVVFSETLSRAEYRIFDHDVPAENGNGADGDDGVGDGIEAGGLEIEDDEPYVLDRRVVRPGRGEVPSVAIGDRGAAHSSIDPARIARELQQPENRSKAALQDSPVVAAEERRRQIQSGGALAYADARLLAEHDAHGVGRFAEYRLVFGQPRCGSRETIERRASKARAGRDPEHPAHVDQRAQRRLLEVKRR